MKTPKHKTFKIDFLRTITSTWKREERRRKIATVVGLASYVLEYSITVVGTVATRSWHNQQLNSTIKIHLNCTCTR